LGGLDGPMAPMTDQDRSRNPVQHNGSSGSRGVTLRSPRRNKIPYVTASPASSQWGSTWPKTNTISKPKSVKKLVE